MTLLFVPREGMPTDPVKMGGNDFSTSGSSGTIFSGVQFGADGNLYERQANGGWSRFSTWLYNGSSGDYYLSRTIDSGTLDTDAGAGPLVMSTNRIYDIQLTFDGFKTANVTFNISNDMSGTPIIDTQSWTFSIERGFL